MKQHAAIKPFCISSQQKFKTNRTMQRSVLRLQRHYDIALHNDMTQEFKIPICFVCS